MLAAERKYTKKKSLPFATVRAIMKGAGGLKVSEEAVNAMIEACRVYIIETTRSALELTKNSKRTKVSVDDIDLALRSGMKVKPKFAKE